MIIHIDGRNGLYGIYNYDIENKVVTVLMNRIPIKIPFDKIRLIREVYSAEDKKLYDAITFKPYYKAIRIPKKNGSFRTVYMLTDKDVLKRQKLLAKKVSRSLSVKKCVEKHLGKKYVLKLDIKSAFAYVHLSKFRFLDPDLEYSFDVKGYLMQGTPCSSYLFERYMLPFDNEIEKIDVCITRYVDDITISSDVLEKVYETKDKIEKILLSLGLFLNESKTRLLKSNKAGFKVHGVNISQGRMGVRARKERAFLLIKHGETEKGIGLLSYISQFVDTHTKHAWNVKVERLIKERQ